jgi:mannose-6-phosphate isomerase-like protein (cupin superfamily)
MVKKLIARRLFVNPIFKDRVTVLKTSEETGGVYSLGELEISPGGGNPMHSHSTFEETFTAVKGILGISLKGEKYYLKPGDSITVPLHTPHHFFNNGQEPVTCHVRFNPGNEDFVKGLAVAYGLAADGKTNKIGLPKNLTNLAIMVSLMDTRPTGFLGLLFPLFKKLAKKAKRNGTEQRLLEKYYFE